jgi:hypothetical protein
MDYVAAGKLKWGPINYMGKLETCLLPKHSRMLHQISTYIYLHNSRNHNAV